MSSMCRYLVLSCPDLFNCANKAGEGSRRWVSGEWWRQASRHVLGHVSASPGDTAHVCRTMGWGRGTKYPWTHIHRYTLSAWKITKADNNYNAQWLPVASFLFGDTNGFSNFLHLVCFPFATIHNDNKSPDSDSSKNKTFETFFTQVTRGSLLLTNRMSTMKCSLRVNIEVPPVWKGLGRHNCRRCSQDWQRDANIWRALS